MEEGEQRTRQPEFAKVFLIDRGKLFKKKTFAFRGTLDSFFLFLL